MPKQLVADFVAERIVHPLELVNVDVEDRKRLSLGELRDPLLEMAAPYLRLPVTRLVIRPGEQGRDPNPDRFTAERAGPGASVLLLDDSWVSGASAQSAAAALKRAGARHVAVVVLGRHVDPSDRHSALLAARLTPSRYDPDRCAVHSSSPTDTMTPDPSGS